MTQFVFQSLNDTVYVVCVSVIELFKCAWLVFQSLNYIVCVFCISVTELYQFVWLVFQSLNDTCLRGLFQWDLHQWKVRAIL